MHQRHAIICLILALLLPAQVAWASRCDDPKPLRLALTPIKNPEARIAQYRLLIAQLEKALARRIEIIPAPSYGTVIEGLLTDGVDLAELGPASYAIAINRGARIHPFATFSLRPGRHTDSPAFYRSLLIVRKELGILNLHDLRGHTIGLTDPASTSGALLPRQAIQQLSGTSLESYFKRVTFTGSHDRAIEAVKKGQIDAAFVASGRLDEALRNGSLHADDYRVLWQSSPIPYDPFVLRDRLCPALVKKIHQVFLGDTSAFGSMFEELGTTGFVPSTDRDYQEIRRLFPGHEAKLGQ